MQKPNKKSSLQSVQSQSKFMKSKYVQSKKPTVSTFPNRIMLTDLCPQEKAKIGELIKTLEQRKKQNEDLQDQLNSWKSNYLTLQKVKLQLQNMIDRKQKQCIRISQQLQKLTKDKIQKDIQMHQVKQQLQIHVKSLTNRTSSSTNTQPITTQTQQTQTKQKRRKTKDRQIQVNTFQQLGGQPQKTLNFYQPNSKVFSKIMNNERLLSSEKKNYQTAAFREDHLQEHDNGGENVYEGYQNVGYEEIDSKRQKIKRHGSNLDEVSPKKTNDGRQWSEYDEDNARNQKFRQNIRSTQEQIQVQDTENDDDQFQMLAKKWLQLKEKNIQQLSSNWFAQQPQDSTNLKSLQIQSKLEDRPKGRSNHIQNQIHRNNQQEQSSQLDENQLNKALRSQDFSASRLLKSKSKRNISQNSDKKSMESSHASYRNNLKSELNRLENKPQSVKNKLIARQEKGQPPRPQKSNLDNSRSKIGPDFYSADLLDLVEEINK